MLLLSQLCSVLLEKLLLLLLCRSAVLLCRVRQAVLLLVRVVLLLVHWLNLLRHPWHGPAERSSPERVTCAGRTVGKGSVEPTS